MVSTHGSNSPRGASQREDAIYPPCLPIRRLTRVVPTTIDHPLKLLTHKKRFTTKSTTTLISSEFGRFKIRCIYAIHIDPVFEDPVIVKLEQDIKDLKLHEIASGLKTNVRKLLLDQNVSNFSMKPFKDPPLLAGLKEKPFVLYLEYIAEFNFNTIITKGHIYLNATIMDEGSEAALVI
nr:DNA polymerase alpha catalytic subunit [Tanacetum cinerariifolium]